MMPLPCALALSPAVLICLYGVGQHQARWLVYLLALSSLTVHGAVLGLLWTFTQDRGTTWVLWRASTIGLHVASAVTIATLILSASAALPRGGRCSVGRRLVGTSLGIGACVLGWLVSACVGLFYMDTESTAEMPGPARVAAMVARSLVLRG